MVFTLQRIHFEPEINLQAISYSIVSVGLSVKLDKAMSLDKRALLAFFS